MMRRGLWVLLVISAFVFPQAMFADTVTSTIPVTATFLLTSSDPSALNTQPFDLAALGITSGSTITITELGAFQPCSSCGDTVYQMIGLFSSGDTLLSSDQLNRVPDAIGVGVRPFTTSTTIFGGLATDITQDFAIGYDSTNLSVTLTVPEGAKFLFIAAPDSFYSDNLDPNGDYAAQITFTPTAVPEPSSLLLLAAGLVGCATPVFRAKLRK